MKDDHRGQPPSTERCLDTLYRIAGRREISHDCKPQAYLRSALRPDGTYSEAWVVDYVDEETGLQRCARVR